MIQTITSLEMPIDEQFKIVKNRLTGGDSTKRICIVTGTHGDELEGQYVCYKINEIISAHPEKLNGIVDIYPALNPLGIDSITRGIPAFDLDMNRIFPGNPNGSMAEKVANAIFEDIKGADMVIDIHSSNIFLREMPQVRVNEQTAEHLVPFAKLLNIDFIWIHEAATVLESTLAHSLNKTGTPVLVAEMGVGMRINHSLGNQLNTGIFNLMNHLGLWADSIPASQIKTPTISQGDRVSFINASVSGVFITEIHNDSIVEEGQNLGQIVSPLTGDILQNVLSPVKGILFTLRAYPIVYEGSLIARIHRIEEP